MRIEVIICESINESCSGMTCFNASDYVSKKIVNQDGLCGIVIIDDVATKFSFSPTFNDGDIFTENEVHRMMIKNIIPIYVYSKLKELTGC